MPDTVEILLIMPALICLYLSGYYAGKTAGRNKALRDEWERNSRLQDNKR